MEDTGKRRWGDYLFLERIRWDVALLLFPLLLISWIYGLVVSIRIKLYRGGLLKQAQLPCKVISVGNITLGGTGKTPMVAHLARGIQKNGVRVGIVSRGYKGLKEDEGGVLSDGGNIYMTPAEAGDEPFMLAKMLVDVPVLVGRNRYEVGFYAYERFGLDVLILDDGFQHLGIKRDLDIVLIDTRRGFGNGHLFPRGPLREPLRGLRRASFLVLSKTDSSKPMGKIEGVLRDLAPAVPLCHSRYKPDYLMEASSGRVFPPQFVQGKKTVAFAGIADPDYFIYLLEELGAEMVKEVRFPDHHRYASKDLRMMREYRDIAEVFVTTEKDYVKLQDIPFGNLPLFILGVEQEILEEEAFFRTVLSALLS